MIAKTVGTIDGDVVRLDHPLDLPNASRVELTITPLDASCGRWDDEVMENLEPLCDQQPIGSSGTRVARDDLHERR
jgi:hypothetical protein